jgi:hypothetical protein
MLRTVFKVIFIGGIVIVGAALLGLFLMSSIARMNGVESLSIPADTYISGHAQTADYTDAYRTEMLFNQYRNIDDIIANAWEKGSGAIYRTEKEVCYEGASLGTTFRISYILDLEAKPVTLTVCRTIHYADTKAEWYYPVVMPFQRMLMPFMVDRMAKERVR